MASAYGHKKEESFDLMLLFIVLLGHDSAKT